MLGLGVAVTIVIALMTATRLRLSPVAATAAAPTRVVVLGFDGLDARLAERWMEQGLLPNFTRLRDAGGYRRLPTTRPAESPVAWSSFVTGLNPGQTGIFGFLGRDPTTYQPYFAPTMLLPGKSLWGWLPIRRPRFVNARHGTPFWKKAADAGRSAAILFCPETFPPARFGGRLLAGPEAPDLLGTSGTFRFYVSDSTLLAGAEASTPLVLVRFDRDVAVTQIRGPRDWVGADGEPMTVPLRLIRRGRDTLQIDLQGQRIRLGVREWSPWMTLRFRRRLWLRTVGIARFYLRRLNPSLKLYLSPINIDPREPAFRISYPADFSKEMAAAVGLYKTLGWGADTWALNDGFLDDHAFLQDARQTFEERRRMFLHILRVARYRLVVAVFNSMDRVQHMFWSTPGSPTPSPRADGSSAPAAVLEFYQLADSLLGEVLAEVGEDAQVVVISDHGFASYRKQVNLNNWLLGQGFLRRASGQRRRGSVDRASTQAYALGFSGIYVNLRGREASGRVAAGEAYDSLRADIRRRLLAWRDPESGERIVESVALREEVYSGAWVRDAPDLVIGLRPGYRVSQKSTFGELETAAVSANLRRWSGDHVSTDPKFVPGVLFSNRPLPPEGPASISDVAGMVLEALGVRQPDGGS